MNTIPEAERPRQLALLRYRELKKTLGRTISVYEANAFKMGYLAALSDNKIKSGE